METVRTIIRRRKVSKLSVISKNVDCVEYPEQLLYLQGKLYQQMYARHVFVDEIFEKYFFLRITQKFSFQMICDMAEDRQLFPSISPFMHYFQDHSFLHFSFVLFVSVVYSAFFSLYLLILVDENCRHFSLYKGTYFSTFLPSFFHFCKVEWLNWTFFVQSG